MHLGRKYTVPSYLAWTRWEIAYLSMWALFVTALFEFLHLTFLAIPEPLLAVVGTALAIILGFKNQECYVRVREALEKWEGIESASIILANNLLSTVGKAEALAGADADALLKTLFYRHFAWLTVLRFKLREPKRWENLLERGNAKFMADLPTPESRSDVAVELGRYLDETELRTAAGHSGDKADRIMAAQYATLGELHLRGVFTANVFVNLTRILDELARLRGAVARIKDYPYPRNYYSIAIILVHAFVAILPFALFPLIHDVAKASGLGSWADWLNVPFSVFAGWIFTTLEKVGENSSNPFEGGPNDVPISFMSRRIEIQMRGMLGEAPDLQPIEPQFDILF